MNAHSGTRPANLEGSAVFGFTFGIYNQSGPWSDRRSLGWHDLATLLTTHAAGPKVGSCIVPATFTGDRRHKSNAEQIDVVFLDSDAGASLGEISAAITARGWAAIIASTHSHMARHTVAKRSNWERWCAQQTPGNAAPSLAEAFLLEEKGYLPRVAAGARLVGEEGDKITIEHSPCPKFRIAIPLAQPWRAANYPNQDAANGAWKERIEALAAALGLDHDQSCSDTSRLFYLPRRPADGPSPQTAVVEGGHCDIFALRGTDDTLFEHAAGPEAEKPRKKRRGKPEPRPEFSDQETGEIIDLGRWAKRYAERFEIVTALQARQPGVFVGHVADGVKHHIRCANEDEHTHAGQDAATFIVNASESREGHKGFTYHCRHGHCDARDRLFFLRRMLEQGWLKVADLTAPEFLVGGEVEPAGEEAASDGFLAPLPLIRSIAGKIPEIVDQAEDALIQANLGIYQRGQFVVRPGRVRVTVPKKGEWDALRVVEVGVHALVEMMSMAANWEKYDARSEDWVPIDAPLKVAETYRQRIGRWNLPVLTGLINAPTLRPDGSILSAHGYDKATGLLLDLRGCRYPEIPEYPTTDDADAALQVLKGLVGTFPYVGEADRAVALSTILTACIRRSLPTAPMHAFTAPTAGSGKSKLVDIASVVATGRVAAVIAQGKTDEEMEKRLGALLLAGDQIIAIDNCDAPLGGETLCQMLTQTMVRARILGRSEAPELPSNALVTATGNNLTLAGDMTRRAMLCRIDPNVERPELREFNSDPVDMVMHDRGRYVVAALTILRAYHVAGRPPQPGSRPLGSFTEWSRWVRDALLWVGEADPVATMEEARAHDPKLEALSAVMEQWREVVGDSATTVRTLIEKATSYSTGEWGKPEFKYPEFREALLQVAGDKGSVNSFRLGKWLGAQKGRVVNGARFDQGSPQRGSVVWSLVQVEAGR